MNIPQRKILIVEDTSAITDRIIEMLKEAHQELQFCTASCYREGVSMLKQHDVDIALLDINLPDKSGIELLKYITPNFPHVAVIMISNSSSETYRNYCKNEGAFHFIDKSTEFETIPEVVDSVFFASIS
jgi:DNA-binding NarL/FixJ family response regulator